MDRDIVSNVEMCLHANYRRVSLQGAELRSMPARLYRLAGVRKGTAMSQHGECGRELQGDSAWVRGYPKNLIFHNISYQGDKKQSTQLRIKRHTAKRSEVHTIEEGDTVNYHHVIQQIEFDGRTDSLAS
jgi:hypothetical protein